MNGLILMWVAMHELWLTRGRQQNAWRRRRCSIGGPQAPRMNSAKQSRYCLGRCPPPPRSGESDEMRNTTKLWCTHEDNILCSSENKNGRQVYTNVYVLLYWYWCHLNKQTNSYMVSRETQLPHLPLTHPFTVYFVALHCCTQHMHTRSSEQKKNDNTGFEEVDTQTDEMDVSSKTFY